MFLVGMAAAAVPIILHLLKREPEVRVKFAAVKMLKHAPVEHTEKHRLRELLLLALRVATIVLLALAFARPFFATGEAAARTTATVVALDTSYSMSAPGRFEQAKQLARDAVARAARGELVGVVTFADDAETVAKPTVDRVAATSAIDHAASGFGATRYRSGLSTAAQALAGRTGSIIVVTDLQESGWDIGDRAAIPAGVRVEVADVGAMPPNLAVTAVRPLDDRIVATIHNSAPRSRDVRAHLTVDGRRAGDATAAVGPGQSADVTFAGAPRGTIAAVDVEDPDGLAADNVRYAVVAGSTRPRVVIVGGSGNLARDAFYVQHALSASAGGHRAYEIVAASGADLSSGGEATLGDPAAVIVVSTRGLERRGRETLAAYVRAGGGLLLAAGPDVDGDVATDVLGPGTSLRIVTGAKPEPRTLAPADLRHPIFRPFSGGTATLGLVRVQNAARIDATGCHTLARFTTGGNAALECAAGDGRAIVLASDLDNRWNDFPLHASFVPFLHETVRYLASTRAHASDYVVGDVPAGVPWTPGVHVVPAIRPGQPVRRVAVNVDPREGEGGRMSAEEFQSAVAHINDTVVSGPRLEARQQEDDQHLWQYALALMLVTLAVEGFVAAKTV